MKHLKLLGLLAVAVGSLMVVAGSASATTATSSEGSTPNLDMESSNSKLDGSFVTVECAHSTLDGNVESHGSGITIEGDIDFLSWEDCNYIITIHSRGWLSFHADPQTGDAVVTWTGGSFTIHTSIGQCTFTTNGTDIGTLDGGTPAVMNINSAKIPRTAGNFLCGSSGTWTGSYEVTSPSTLEVH